MIGSYWFVYIYTHALATQWTRNLNNERSESRRLSIWRLGHGLWRPWIFEDSAMGYEDHEFLKTRPWVMIFCRLVTDRPKSRDRILTNCRRGFFTMKEGCLLKFINAILAFLWLYSNLPWLASSLSEKFKRIF